MLKMLNWYSSEYEGCRIFKANIIKLCFEGDNNFTLKYIITEDDIGFFHLYFESNEEVFTIGKYKILEVAFQEANQHYKGFLTINS